jgi:GNAT superfamily N-acetyltransferase
MKPTIRLATEPDGPSLLRLGRAFFVQSGLSDVATWDDESFGRSVRALVVNKEPGFLLVAEHDGQIVGMAAAVVFPAYFNLNTRVAQEIFWFVDESHRFGAGAALIEELEKVAQERGATVFMSAAIAGLRDAAIARLYARRGYRPVENTFVKALAT